jgi:hypothetical protein
MTHFTAIAFAGVMAGLVPAIHVGARRSTRDARLRIAGTYARR